MSRRSTAIVTRHRPPKGDVVGLTAQVSALTAQVAALADLTDATVAALREATAAASSEAPIA